MSQLIILTLAGNPEVTCTVYCAQPDPTNVSPLNFTIVFSETVMGFISGDPVVSGGSLSNFAGGGNVYTCDVTPSSPSETVTLTVPAGCCTDLAGNPNLQGTLTIHYTTLPDGLIDYWKLDELSGTRMDSVGTRHMVPGGAGSVGYALGKITNSALTSTTSLLETAADAALLAVDWAAGFSTVGWLYVPTAWAARATVLTKQSGGNIDWALVSYAADTQRFYVVDSTSGTSQATDGTTLSPDTWYFFAGRYNPATKKAEISINGGSWSLGTALTNGPKNSYNTLTINRYAANYADARYDEIGLWSRYLSDAEVLALYAGGSGDTYPF